MATCSKATGVVWVSEQCLWAKPLPAQLGYPLPQGYASGRLPTPGLHPWPQCGSPCCRWPGHGVCAPTAQCGCCPPWPQQARAVGDRMICLRAVFTLQCYDGEVVIQGFAFCVDSRLLNWLSPVATATSSGTRFLLKKDLLFLVEISKFPLVARETPRSDLRHNYDWACESAKFHLGLSDRCES